MSSSTTKRITVPDVRSSKGVKRLVALTAYDFSFARLVDRAGVDIILVGDSLGMVVQGEDTTLPVTLDHMVYHTRCVSNGVTRALVVADMPFLSYQPSIEEAIRSAGRLLKEGRASAVKLEGGVAVRETIERLTQLDVPVMAHVGMTPQSIHRMGGFKQQGKTHRADGTFRPGSYEQIIEDALAVEAAGAFSVVLEGVPRELTQEITQRLSIPTIGIAAGDVADGEILVGYDLVDITDDLRPPFVKPYAHVGTSIVDAIGRWAEHVRSSAALHSSES
jgi:3-methyl-2-oxobutanoate hydroxymethyltransferase